ncbi:MAG: hypothetical protein K0S61_1463 [Anaerocolumna sp.]|jgi:hypothetical protein|nr:hypothetical protein [Anaerocolumna sp.]
MTYSSNIQNSSASYQTSKSSTSSGINSSSPPNNSTGGLYKGQQLSGEVMDLRNDEVSVRLQDGRVLNAKMEDTSALSIGEKVSFKVMDVTNSNLTLKLISDSTSSSLNQILDKALDSAGLSKNSRNRAIVGELLKQQMSIDKNTINLLIKQSMTFKDTPISTLVLLNKYQLPVTQENLKLFEEYEKNAHNIYSDLENMASSITDLLQSVNVSDEVFIKDSKQLLQTLFPGKSGTKENSSSLLNQLVFSKESLTELNHLLNSSQDMTVKEFINSTTLLSNGTLTTEQAKDLLSLLKASNITLSHMPTELEQLINNSLPTHPDSKANAITPNVNITNSNVSQGSINHLDNANILQNHNINQLDLESIQITGMDKTTAGLTKLDLSFLDNLQTYGFPKESLYSIGNKSEIFTYLTNQLDSLDVETAKTLLNSSDFKELIKDELLSKWSLSPNQFADKERVDSHLESLVKDIRNLSSFLEQTSLASGAKVGGQASNLMDNLNFMNQLNHFLTYAQIPVKLNTGYTKSELYVYSKRKRNTENDSSISVLLHLDMNNLGPLDIYLKLDKNQLESTFYCDNDNIMTLITKHLDTLTHTLTEKGLQITATVQPRTKTVNVIEEILNEEASDSFGIRYNFDVRA